MVPPTTDDRDKAGDDESQAAYQGKAEDQLAQASRRFFHLFLY